MGFTLAGADNANYTITATTATTVNITKADPSCTITGYDVTYDGSPHTATGSFVVIAETLAAPDLSGTTHTTAGSCGTDPWSAVAERRGLRRGVPGTVRRYGGDPRDHGHGRDRQQDRRRHQFLRPAPRRRSPQAALPRETPPAPSRCSTPTAAGTGKTLTPSGTVAHAASTASPRATRSRGSPCRTGTITPGPAATLEVSAISPQTAGNPFDVTVTALDAYGDAGLGFGREIHFTSSDVAATLPADYTFLVGDNGTKLFSAGVTLETAGTKSITATDTGTGSTGSRRRTHRRPRGRRRRSR